MAKVFNPNVTRESLGTWAITFSYQLPQKKREWTRAIVTVEQHLAGLGLQYTPYCRAEDSCFDFAFTLSGPMAEAILQAKAHADSALEQADLNRAHLVHVTCEDEQKLAARMLKVPPPL